MLSSTKKELSLKRAQFFSCVRSFFEKKSFVEVRTPFLVSNPGLEPHLSYFESTYSGEMSDSEEKLYYLPTSPEYHLKIALSWGLEKIYEIKKSFRNGEKGRHHAPEFEMLEWYRLNESYQSIAQDSIELFEYCSQKLTWAKNFSPMTQLQLPEYFQEKTGLSFGELRKKHGVHFVEEFSRLMVDQVESSLKEIPLVILWNFPKELAALSQESSDYEDCCERFEIYIHGIEIANCFGELCDKDRLIEKCKADIQERKRLHPLKNCPELDENFIQAHDSIDQAAGIALGLDRLFCALAGYSSLSEANPFAEKI